MYIVVVILCIEPQKSVGTLHVKERERELKMEHINSKYVYTLWHYVLSIHYSLARGMCPAGGVIVV